MRRALIILGAEICLFVGPYMIDPAWTTSNALALLVVGAIILFIGLIWEHIPRSLTFFSSYFWPDMEAASRLFRDYLKDQPVKSALMEFDNMASDLEGDGNDLPPTLRAFHSWLVVGLSEGKLDCYGVSKHGSRPEKINGKPSESIDQYHLINKEPTSILMESGEVFRDVTVRRASLRVFADWLGARCDKPQTGP